MIQNLPLIKHEHRPRTNESPQPDKPITMDTDQQNNAIEAQPSARFLPQQWLTPFSISDLFDDTSRPFEIDLGCGKGRFLLNHAANHPNSNYLGVDRMLKRIRKIARKVERADMRHVRLFRMDGFYTVAYLVPPRSVDTYYVFFPDPWPKTKHHANRIFNSIFLTALHRTMKIGAQLHFSTDHLPYYQEVYALLCQDTHFKQIETYEPPTNEKSDFELMFIDEKKIGRCSFELKNND